MKKLALALIALIAALHYYIAWFEMFAWTTRGPKVFETFPAELFEKTVQMAANQGLYNAFLAIGLTWALLIKDSVWQRHVAVCFLLFVLVAGFGAAVTVALKPGLVQIIPSAIALGVLMVANRQDVRG